MPVPYTTRTGLQIGREYIRTVRPTTTVTHCAARNA